MYTTILRRVPCLAVHVLEIQLSRDSLSFLVYFDTFGDQPFLQTETDGGRPDRGLAFGHKTFCPTTERIS
jgi:hypothetical protein